MTGILAVTSPVIVDRPGLGGLRPGRCRHGMRRALPGPAGVRLVRTPAASRRRHLLGAGSPCWCRHTTRRSLVGRCIASLRQQSYPADLYEIVVIADNCTDDTAARAAAAGATVMVRTAPDARGKGPALRWAMDRLLERDPDLAALAVVDADSVADPGLLGALVARLEQGASGGAGRVPGPATRTGRSGPSCALPPSFSSTGCGSGVAPSSGCRATWWATGCSSAARCWRTIPGTRSRAPRTSSTRSTSGSPGCGPSTPVTPGSAAPVVGRGRAAQVQRLRWEGGRFHVVRTRLPLLLAAVFVASALVPARRRRRPGGAPARPAGGRLGARGVARCPPPRGRGRPLVGGRSRGWSRWPPCRPSWWSASLPATPRAPCGGRSRWPPPWWWPRSGPVSGF